MIHNLVLQRLNRLLTTFGAPVYYPKSTFANVDYTGRPVILWEGRGSPIHPDFRDVTSGKLPAGYRVVGQITNTALDGDLQRVDAHITDEALSAEMHAHPDRFAVSSGFWGGILNGVMRYVYSPNHVLLFSREAGRPNDAFAQVCNTFDNAIYPVSLDTGIKIMTANPVLTPPAVQVGNAPAAEPALEKAKDGETSELEQLRAENAQLKALAEQLVTQLQEIQAAMQQAAAQQQQAPMPAPAAPPMAVGNVAADATAEIERLRKKCAEYEWQKMEPNLPPAMRGAAGRAAYDADPLGFMRDAISAPRQVVNTAPAEGATIAPTAPSTEPETFLTPEYAIPRQIGNVKAPAASMEGARIGPSQWMLYGGIKLDTTEIDRHFGRR